MNYIVLDLETTCWDGAPLADQREIIEIGAYKLDAFGDIVDEYVQYVQPILTPSLSMYCKQLTGIEQEAIDSARPWSSVSADFVEWMDDPELIIAWGKYDRTIIQADCRLHDVDSSWIDNYLDLKRSYRLLKGYQSSKSLQRAVEREFGEWEGEMHRALPDAYYTAKIYARYLREWKR